MQLRQTSRGHRLVHGSYVLSELPHHPGPTHSVFDLFAAAAAAFSPGGALVLLGFAAGGMVAPLRALGLDDRVEGVDLELLGAKVFARVARDWAGAVRVIRMDAEKYLRRRTRPAACIVEDLSIQLGARRVEKPEVCFQGLPRQVAGRLAPDGLAVFNLFPTGGRSWASLERAVAEPFAEARVVRLHGFDNRVVLAGRSLPAAREVRKRLDAMLTLIGSRLAGAFSVRAR